MCLAQRETGRRFDIGRVSMDEERFVGVASRQPTWIRWSEERERQPTISSLVHRRRKHFEEISGVRTRYCRIIVRSVKRICFSRCCRHIACLVCDVTCLPAGIESAARCASRTTPD
jgi:hypothetical protein